MVHAFQHNHVYYMFYFVKKHHVGKNVKNQAVWEQNLFYNNRPENMKDSQEQNWMKTQSRNP